MLADDEGLDTFDILALVEGRVACVGLRLEVALADCVGLPLDTALLLLTAAGLVDEPDGLAEVAAGLVEEAVCLSDVAVGLDADAAGLSELVEGLDVEALDDAGLDDATFTPFVCWLSFGLIELAAELLLLLVLAT